jgi:hypothetical protein
MKHARKYGLVASTAARLENYTFLTALAEIN